MADADVILHAAVDADGVKTGVEQAKASIGSLKQSSLGAFGEMATGLRGFHRGLGQIKMAIELIRPKHDIFKEGTAILKQLEIQSDRNKIKMYEFREAINSLNEQTRSAILHADSFTMSLLAMGKAADLARGQLKDLFGQVFRAPTDLSGGVSGFLGRLEYEGRALPGLLGRGLRAALPGRGGPGGERFDLFGLLGEKFGPGDYTGVRTGGLPAWLGPAAPPSLFGGLGRGVQGLAGAAESIAAGGAGALGRGMAGVAERDAQQLAKVSAVMQELADRTTMAGAAYGAFSNSIAAGVEAAISGGEGIGKAMRKAAAQSLKATAVESSVKALWEGAQSIASLAVGHFGGAAAHGKAAAMFAATALAAGAGAAALGGGGSGSAGPGGGGGGGLGPGAGYVSNPSSQGNAPVTVIIQGNVGSDDGARIIKQIEQAIRTGRSRN